LPHILFLIPILKEKSRMRIKEEERGH